VNRSGAGRGPLRLPRITAGRLTRGWAGPGGTRLRLVRPGEATRVEQLLHVAGIPLDPELTGLIDLGDTATAVLQGLTDGPDRLLGLLANALAAGDPTSVLPSLVTVLVAVNRIGALVGALLAAPPATVLSTAAAGGVALERVMFGAAAVTTVQALAVDPAARRRGIGTALLERCTQLYEHLGFYLVCGQFRAGSGLETYYSRRGFDVLPLGEGISLTRLGLPVRISAGSSERLFFRWRTGAPSPR